MTNREIRSVLTIAGSDSGAGAGIQADLKTFAALGVYGTTAITAVTAQNTVGVTGVASLSSEFVTAQIEAVAGDIVIHATKTGMLGNAAIVEAVAAAVSELDLPLLVVDPVMVAKSGDRLLDDEGIEALKTELLPRALIVTPNIPEAEILSGRQITSLEQARAAAVEIHRMGGPAVLIKGGHGEGDTIVDLLYGGGDQFTEISTSRIDSKNTHGTGCTFSAAIAAYLALGSPLLDAVVQAQSYVRNAIEHALELGHGHGPLDHFWQRQAK